VDRVDIEGVAGAEDAGRAAQQVTALYEAHAAYLARLALVILGDQGAAEDVVQDAFFGLYRRWGTLSDPSAALAYLRTSVLNGCRLAMRRRWSPTALPDGQPLESAEATVLHTEQQRAIMAAVRRLPARQREALVLRYFLDMTEEQAAEAMHVSRGTVKSATSRAIAKVGRMLEEGS
jgi:RNA polymerase sigma-70 factor (sigma-E family)